MGGDGLMDGVRRGGGSGGGCTQSGRGVDGQTDEGKVAFRKSCADRRVENEWRQ